MRIFSFIALILSLMSLSGYAEKLRVGTEGVYPPRNYQNQAGELEGFEIELVRELAEIMDVEIEYVMMDFDALIPNLNAGRLDFFLSGMTINNERKQAIDFSTAHAEIPAQFVSADESFKTINSYDELIAALEGKSIGVQTGTIHVSWVENILEDKVESRSYRATQEMASDVTKGRVDVALADKVIWVDYLKENKDAFFTFGPLLSSANDPNLFGEGIGIGIQKGNHALKTRIDAALEEMRKSGKLSELAIKHFDFDASK